ncbi:hypothetical protein ACFQV2_10535 [Actinokineospora soli]|uniref:Asp23/Gls24 family envelope stress response protein n=1 Tax=Actinokineospora soli TaxID=1048753 RepID=A0ABW2TJL8_9PSEU
MSACGRTRAELLRVAADGPGVDPELARHARECPDCAAALAELDGRWADVRAAADERPAAPAGLADRVIDALRGVRGTPGTYHGVDDGVRVADRVVVLVARRLAADAAAGLGHVRAVRADGDTLHIGLAVRWGVAADTLAERVRSAVLTGVATQVGPVVSAVDVQVVDVLPPSIG